MGQLQNKKKTPVKKKPAKKTKTGKHPGGRPTDFKPAYIEQALKLSRLGLTDEEMADVFGVVPATFYNWRNAHPKFLEAIKAGKAVADANVADRLYQRAMGFEHDSEEIRVVSDGRGEGSSIERVPIRKIYPPDTVAAIFWLKNRQPGKWRDRIDADVTSKGESIAPQPPMADSQVDKIINALRKK